MKWKSAFITLLISCAPLPALALGPVTYSAGTIILTNGAQEGRGRSLWVRGRSIYLVFSSNQTKGQSLKVGGKHLQEIKLGKRGNRTELELRFNEAAERLLPKMTIEERGRDLVLRLPAEQDDGAVAPVAAKVKGSSTAPAPAAPLARTSTATKNKRAAQGEHVAGPVPAASETALASVLGRNKTSTPPLARGQESSTFSFGLIALVIALGGGAAYWLRRHKNTAPPSNTHVNILSTRALSAKHKLVMVDAAGEILLLGCTEKEIRLLQKIKPDRVGAPIAPQQEATDEAARPPVAPSQNHLSSLEESIMPPETSIPQEQSTACAPRLILDHESPRAEAKTTLIPPQWMERNDFVTQLSQQIQKRQQHDPPPAATATDNEHPLDERWAQGIIKLRRARQMNQAATTSPPPSTTSASVSSSSVLH